jgi:dethiobiotin synthetase
MAGCFIITGTDTGIGKTIFAAALAQNRRAAYWKPVQAGLDEETDTQAVARLTGHPPELLLPEAYRLKEPASPHKAAALENIMIDPARLVLPETNGPLVVEGAGGVLVPLNRDILYADLFARWQKPVILCARTALGTINHTLLSLEALRSRNVPVHGVAFVGDDAPDTIAIIAERGKVRVLGRLPWLDNPTPHSLKTAFATHFDARDFITNMESI